MTKAPLTPEASAANIKLIEANNATGWKQYISPTLKTVAAGGTLAGSFLLLNQLKSFFDNEEARQAAQQCIAEEYNNCNTSSTPPNTCEINCPIPQGEKEWYDCYKSNYLELRNNGTDDAKAQEMAREKCADKESSICPPLVPQSLCNGLGSFFKGMGSLKNYIMYGIYAFIFIIIIIIFFKLFG